MFFSAPAGPPRNLAGFPTSPNSIYITWLSPSPSLTNGIIREYYVNVTNSETGEREQLLSQSESLEVTNLHPYSTYELAVAAHTVALGPFSQHIILQTWEDGMKFLWCIIKSFKLCFLFLYSSQWSTTQCGG